MPSTAAVLNALSRDEAARVLASCCGATRWVQTMLEAHPFASDAALLDACGQAFAGLMREDFLEAFSHHPRIGAQPAEIAAHAGPSADLARDEQAGAASADQTTRDQLREANQLYAERFGYIFLVCAKGKGASEMLELLRARLHNDPETELRIAAGEQAKITRLRLDRLAS
jgi:2-oxo-4-hydroxy-4-carboxy-5-ureidoimidazoline decarboxylase